MSAVKVGKGGTDTREKMGAGALTREGREREETREGGTDTRSVQVMVSSRDHVQSRAATLPSHLAYPRPAQMGPVARAKQQVDLG